MVVAADGVGMPVGRSAIVPDSCSGSSGACPVEAAALCTSAPSRVSDVDVGPVVVVGTAANVGSCSCRTSGPNAVGITKPRGPRQREPFPALRPTAVFASGEADGETVGQTTGQAISRGGPVIACPSIGVTARVAGGSCRAACPSPSACDRTRRSLDSNPRRGGFAQI